MYYCLPIVVGLKLNGYTTVIVALTIYSAAFFSEGVGKTWGSLFMMAASQQRNCH